MNAPCITRSSRAAADDIAARLQERTTRSWRSTPQDNPNKGWTHETRYTFVDGKTVTLNGRSVNALAFPATPGFELLRFERPEHGDPATHEIAGAIRREPIVGWILINDGRRVIRSP